ncbi:MAG: carbonate dehydratase [Archangium sp.]|nr:carbonate dehydratase [Archangium sp.]MDP3154075.1 carbonate dehydratase [Archangium sp.]MDP3570021.1 carbonate dehydratase [Archangium sp.]
MDNLVRLLDSNKAWAAARLSEDRDYFNRLAHLQQPEFLWIGCSDSRVAANVITGTQPGEIFVHRNIANMVVHTDMNLLSVLEYSVNVLKVKHIIVCGHYGCGGVKAASEQKSLGIINNWLRNIEDVFRTHRDELTAIPGEKQRVDRLVELNVEEQVLNLAKTSIVQRAWKIKQETTLHGWVYGLDDGIIKPLTQVDSTEAIDPVYRYDNL